MIHLNNEFVESAMKPGEQSAALNPRANRVPKSSATSRSLVSAPKNPVFDWSVGTSWPKLSLWFPIFANKIHNIAESISLAL